MSKKHVIIIIFLSIIILILGITLFTQNRSTNFIKISEDFLKGEIISNEIAIKHLGNLMKKADENNYTNYFFKTYDVALTILGLTKELQKEIEQNITNVNTKKIIDFSENQGFYVDEKLMSMISLLSSSNYDSQEKQYILLLIKNHFLQKCISHFYSHSLPLAYGQIINYAKRDTVNFGEVYQSQILFNAMDVRGNIITLENGDTIKYGKFEEKAIKRGHNNKKGYMQISYGSKTDFYEVNIDYYVR